MDIGVEAEKYLEYCRYRKELNWNTLKAYKIDLKQYITFIKGDALLKVRIEEYITWLHKNYKQKTIKRKIASIKAFYKYLEEEEILTESNPFNRIKVKFKETESLPRIIPREDIERLLNHMYRALEEAGTAGDACLIYRDLSVVEVFFATGVRVYELSNLKKRDVDLSSGMIVIMGKGGRERCVQIGNEDVLMLLRRYYEYNRERIEQCGYFFANGRGHRFTEQSVRRMLRKYTKQAGIAIHITPHMFRHSVATYLLEEGVDIMYIQRILGHGSIKTTQIYLHLTSRKQMEILKQMHPRNKMKILRAA